MNRVNFGLWYDFRNPEPWAVPFEKLYADSLDQIEEAEKLGFDSIWMTEHHFCDDGYTPSPLVMAAAIGQRTRSMRIGTNLMILPLHDPIRIAEDAGTVSLLTGGRFDLGVGIGYRHIEYQQFGRDIKHRPSLIEEAIEIIRRAWSGERVDFDGKRFKVHDIPVRPVPENPPKIYLGGMAPPAVDRAARIADGFLSTGGIGHDTYVDCLKKNDRSPDDGVIIAGNWAIIANDPEAEAARIGDHILYQSNQYIEWGAFGDPQSTPRFPDAATAIKEGLYELWTADTAVENLTAMLEQYPQIRDVHFWAQFPGEPVESGQRRIEYIAKNVLPRVREAIGSAG